MRVVQPGGEKERDGQEGRGIKCVFRVDVHCTDEGNQGKARVCNREVEVK